MGTHEKEPWIWDPYLHYLFLSQGNAPEKWELLRGRQCEAEHHKVYRFPSLKTVPSSYPFLKQME